MRDLYCSPGAVIHGHRAKNACIAYKFEAVADHNFANEPWRWWHIGARLVE
jgi:hypothetical protein